MRAATLLRVQRPLVPTASPVRVSERDMELAATPSRALSPLTSTPNPSKPQPHQALVHPLELEAWVSGAPPRGDASLLLSPDELATAATAANEHPPNSLRRITLFSLNDYLGLSAHPDVRRAASQAALACGMGPRASGVVAGGQTHYHRALERELAALKKTEDAVLFPTGFAANVAVVSALAGLGSPSSNNNNVVILSDELNHASIVDGARLAARASGGGGGASSPASVTIRVYRHNDLAHLEQLLTDPATKHARKMVVTDTLFSMDGDFADLPGLAALRRRHKFLLVVDDAHATLVCGSGSGSGACEMFGLDPHQDVDVQVGTLSKAFGALGGFAACSAEMRALLVNRGRAGVFSTALPVPVVAAASAAMAAARREPWRRAHVWRLARRLGRRLGVPALSPVVPLVVGGERDAVELSARLLERHGVHCPAIRPPTVPAGTCRLRVTLSAAHSVADVDALADAVEEELRRWGEDGGGGQSRRRLELIRLPFLVEQEARMARIGVEQEEGGVASRSRL